MRCYKIHLLVLTLYWATSFQLKASSPPDYYWDYLNAYDVTFYYINLRLNNLAPEADGYVSMHVAMRQISDSIAVELNDDAEIDSLLLNNQKTVFVHSGELIRFLTPDTASAGDTYIITVYYSIVDTNDPDTRGIATKMLPDGKSVTWTLSEPFYSKDWFPCKQVLDDKADSAYLYFTVADSLKVGSNGVLKRVVPVGNRQLRYEWETNYPVAYYLLSFTVADFLDYSYKMALGEDDSLLIQNYIYNDSNYLQINKPAIDITADLIRTFSDKFGNYPFAKEKYGHCLAPIGGGMEHQTMTTLVNFDFDLVAHELAHQWFGDYVTCKDWQHIWINEGFASYAEYIAIENLKNITDRTDWLSDAYSLSISEPDGSVFIPDEDSLNDERIFNYRLTYRKGAYILHMLRHEIDNDTLFFDILKTYLARFSNSNATADDFRMVVEENIHRPVESFFNEWYYGEGHPVLRIQWKYSDDTLTIYLNQEGSCPEKTPFFNITIDFRIFYFNGDTTIRLRQESATSVYEIPFDRRVYMISADQDNWLLKEIQSIERILENDSVRFCIFPNPAGDSFHIENFDIGLPFEIQIYDMQGKLIYSRETAETFLTVPLLSYPKGVYQVVVSRGRHEEIFKLVKI